MNARIVGETYRHDAGLGGGGSGRAWEDADLPLGRPVVVQALRPETAVLAAIRSGYEDARERIIAAEPPAVPDPTIPVDVGAGLPRPPRDAHPPVAGPRRPLPGRPAGRDGHGPLRSLLTRLVPALG